MEFSDYLKQAEEIEKKAEELTNEASDFEQDAEKSVDEAITGTQTTVGTGGTTTRIGRTPQQKNIDNSKPTVDKLRNRKAKKVNVARATPASDSVRQNRIRMGLNPDTGLPYFSDKEREYFKPKPKAQPTTEPKAEPGTKTDTGTGETPKKKPVLKPKKKIDDFPIKISAGWDDPKARFDTTGKEKMFPKKAKKDEEGKELDPQDAADRIAKGKEKGNKDSQQQVTLAASWSAPEGEPILFERSKKGLERIIRSSRTSQQQKNEARKKLQKKRQQQIKRADKTAADPNTDLATAVRAADASIDAKEKVKKYKAPPEKKEVKTDFGPPEKAFKDN